MLTPAIRLRFNPPAEPVLVTAGVPVDVTAGVIDGVAGDGIAVGVRVCVGTEVTVGGGVTRSSNFCPTRITESALNPFHAIRSASETSYCPAIHESVSPL